MPWSSLLAANLYIRKFILKEETCITLGFIKYVNFNPSKPISVQCTDLVSFHTLPASVQRTGPVISAIKGTSSGFGQRNGLQYGV